jgi:hypothetical protein
MSAKIPLREFHLEALVATRKVSFLKKNFEAKGAYGQVLSAPAKEQRDILTKIALCYHFLLFNIFHK